MKRMSFIAWVLVSVCLVMVSPVTAGEVIDLKNPQEIKMADSVYQAVDQLSKKVMACIEANNGQVKGCICKDPCSCPFKKEYEAVKKAVFESVEANPHWKEQELFFKKHGEATGYNLSLSGLARQFKNSCQ